MTGRLLHLARRALGSLSNAPPDAAQVAEARAVLLPGEMELWERMDGRDKTHSLQVLSRFKMLVGDAARAEFAAALLHDVGKAAAPIGWIARVWATALFPLNDGMRRYLDHERIGVEMLRGTSDERTIDLLSREAEDDIARALWRADEM